jgi:hypothetical protein
LYGCRTPEAVLMNFWHAGRVKDFASMGELTQDLESGESSSAAASASSAPLGLCLPVSRKRHSKPVPRLLNITTFPSNKSK